MRDTSNLNGIYNPGQNSSTPNATSGKNGTTFRFLSSNPFNAVNIASREEQKAEIVCDNNNHL